MSRKLPLCAKCGKSLAHKDQSLIMFTKMPGRPMLGWHLEPCLFEDPLYADFRQNREQQGIVEHLLNTVATVDRKRVSAGEAWWKYVRETAEAVELAVKKARGI
jgi:hypothetical protein